MSGRLEFLPFEHERVAGPEDVGSEQRWRVRLSDGRAALVGQLGPELARDESLRRRYVGDLERLAALEAVSVIPNFARGPEGDATRVDAEAPWRARLDPDGVRVDVWLDHHAPAPLDAVAHLGASIADALQAVHRRGGVLREVSPRSMLWVEDGRIFFTDVGLSRVDILSSHTASSLLMQGSAYAAPEQLCSTVVDQRSDIYGLGVLLWRALTGTFPYGDGPAFLRKDAALPKLTSLRADVPPTLDELLRRCLSEKPGDRPESVAEIARFMRGQGQSAAVAVARTECQRCGAPLRVGQRLCLACGRVAVKYAHSTEERYAIDLMSIAEEADAISHLHEVLGSVVEGRMPALEFVIGDPNMYSEAERLRRTRLPARLLSDLSRETAEEISGRLTKHGVEVRVVHPRAAIVEAGKGFGALAVGVSLAVLAGQLSGWLAFAITVPLLVVVGVFLTRSMHASSQSNAPSLFRLRKAPAALPASDPLVARLAALLQGDTPEDVRVHVGELALLVQRLVDHRASLLGQAAEIDALTEPVAPLVALIEGQVAALRTITRDLVGLQEGAMVRALAASEARGEPAARREEIHRGLERLRALEDARAAAFHRLLEAASLMRRAIELGLGVHDAQQVHEHHVQLALAALGSDEA